MLSEGLWSFVERGLQEPENLSQLPAAEVEKFEAEVMKDAKAFSKIQNGVTSDIFPRITRAKTTKEAWDTLEKEFQGDSKAITIKLQTLRREFYNMKMKESECIQDYASRLAEVVNQMRTLGEEISDRRVVEKILISLPEKYDPIVAAIEECKDITTLSIEQLMGSLKSHEQRRLTRNDQSVESAFQSKLSFKSQKSSKKGNSRDDQRTGEQRRWKKGESSKRDESKNRKSTILKIISLPAGFVTKQIMIRQIVGTVESQSAIIATNLGTLRRTADSRKQTKQIFLKARMMMMEMKTCSLLVYLPLRKKKASGILTVDAATTCQEMKIFFLMWILQLLQISKWVMVLLWRQKEKEELLSKLRRG